jgi:hypothetical protein
MQAVWTRRTTWFQNTAASEGAKTTDWSAWGKDPATTVNHWETNVTGSAMFAPCDAAEVKVGVRGWGMVRPSPEHGGDSRPVRNDSQTPSHLPQPSIPGPKHVRLAGGCPEQMHVDQPQPHAVTPVAVDEADDFDVGRLGGLRQGFKEPEDFRSPDERSACQFADDERMADDVAPLQKCGRTAIATMQVVDPHRCVEEHQSARPPPGNGPQPRFASAARRQFTSRLPGNQRLEAEPYQLRLLSNPGQPSGPRQGFFIDIERRSHAYVFGKKYASVKAR